MSISNTHLSVSRLAYEWPSGEVLFSEINFSISAHRTALIGANGVGKSTLCRVLAGELKPSAGEINRQGQVVYFKQNEIPQYGVTVLEYLPNLFETMGDVQNHFILDEIQKLEYSQQIVDLSGGEWMKVRLLREFFNPSQILILDEPSNHLDQKSRNFLNAFLKDYPGQILLISHDRSLLRQVENIFELTSLGIQSFSGDYVDYLVQKECNRKIIEDDIEILKREKKQNERASEEKLRNQEKRMKRGQKQNEKGGIPRILAGALKRQAEKTMASTHTLNDRLQIEDSEKLQQKMREREDSTDFVLHGPETSFPEGKSVFEFKEFNVFWDEKPLWQNGFSLLMKGPRRWALKGENGSGKTSIVHVLTGALKVKTAGQFYLGEVKLRLLDQQQSVLTQGRTLVELMRDWWSIDETEARNALALHQFTGDRAFLKSENLSGGERIKAALLSIFYGSRDFIFLVLDEPTNNLDLQSIKLLEEVLAQYQGPMLVISHDEDFLQNLNLEAEITLPSRSK